MNRWIVPIAIALVFVLWATVLPASETARLFMQAVAAYEQQDYEKAVDAFLSIVEKGVHNGDLYYNLGNAYLKKGDLGRSLLWYERSLKLIPGDPDLEFNRDYALTLTRDEAPEDEGRAARVLFFWNYLLDAHTIQVMALALNGIFWLSLGIYARYPKRAIRYVLIPVFTVALFLCATACFNLYGASRSKTAVILETEVSVRSGLGQNTTELFTLHAGSRVRIQKTRGRYYQIRYSRDKLGWIQMVDAEII